MNKKSVSRVEAEKAEDMPTISNEVPENRLQQEQQVADTESALKTEPVDSSFKAKRTTAKGAVLKQEAISDAITGSSSSAGMGINAAGRNVSGTAGGILGANNSTPQAGKSRSETRVGKKLDRIATKLNFTPSEQVILAVDESKPLADSADQDQGYNGTYRNENARSQKIAGAAPADLMFQRSVDLITKDKLYFVEGQMNFQNGDSPSQYNPTESVILDEDGSATVKDVVYPAGNYLHRGMHFGLQPDGKVRYFYADVEDVTATDLNQEDANCASAHRLIKSNTAELDRMTMDAKAGDEKADIWTPLARAIKDPTKASFYMSSVEAETGAYSYLAYSKASTNMAYQLNRGAKDGLNVIGPAIEQCSGWRSSENNSVSLANDFGNILDKDYVFKKESYRLGDPTIMIEAYDSINKYHNKADLLLQPRGYRMHLQTADNNINPLKVPAEFANVYSANECFSTIDRDYDPLLPVCMTDKANLITVNNFNCSSAFFKNSGARHVHLKLTYTAVGSNYSHDSQLLIEKLAMDKLNYPDLYVQFKKVSADGDGLVYDATNHVVKVDGDSSNVTAEYDILVDTKLHTGYTQLVKVQKGSAIDVTLYVPKVTNDITVVQADIEETTWNYYEGGIYGYAYSDLRNNYIVQVKHPLIFGIIDYLEDSIGAKFRSLIDREDFYVPMIFSTQYMTLAQLLICAATPWISRVRLNSMRDVIYYEDNTKSYPYSKLDSIKSVPFKNFVNFVYKDYDSPLETKIMDPVQAIGWIMPEFFWKVATEKYVLPWYFNELDLNNDGTVNDDAANMSMPSIRSGVRLGFLDDMYGMTEKDIRLSLDRMTKYLLKDEDIDSFGAYKYGRTTDGQILTNLDSGKLFTIAKLLTCPRELGLCMDAPLGLLTVDPADGVGVTTSLKALTADGTATSFRIKIWTNVNTYIHPTILNAEGVNINRAANFTQKWFEITANNATSNTDLAGLVFGLGDDTASFSPFAELGTGASLGNSVNVTSYQRALNTRLQFLPFIISPFDGNYTGSQAYDIYDFAYMFGLCGFRASDYRESIYNREKEAVNQGITFVSDPWVEQSPLIRGASASTGVKMSKGYELK